MYALQQYQIYHLWFTLALLLAISLKQRRQHQCQRDDPAHKQELDEHAGATVYRILFCSPPSQHPSPLLLLLGPQMGFPIKVRHVPSSLGLTRSESSPAKAAPSGRPCCSRWSYRVGLGLSPFGLGSPAAASIEAWWCAPKLSSSPTQAAGGSSTVRGAGMWTVANVCARYAGSSFNGPIIFLTFFKIAQHGVGLGDLHKTLGGGRVIGIAIGMMAFGESVELPRSRQPIQTGK